MRIEQGPTSEMTQAIYDRALGRRLLKLRWVEDIEEDWLKAIVRNTSITELVNLYILALPGADRDEVESLMTSWQTRLQGEVE